jgi:NADPH:quinone reductase-like Zn-dependent oxidoreductase
MTASTTPAGPTPPTRSPGRMRAVVQREYGSAEALQPGVVDRPTVKGNEVLVEVRAAGLDRGTWHLMAGVPYGVRLVTGLRSPRNPVPGRDLAGVVAEVGSDVTRFRPGDSVFGIGSGSFAEFAVAHEDKLAAKPASLCFEQSAALGISGLTALRGLCDVGRLRAGQRVLVTGASGGVGTFAVQIAASFGAEVTGVCSTAKTDLVHSLGADRAIDYTVHDFSDDVRRYDLILDAGGNPSLTRLRRALAPRGTLVIVGGEGGGRLTGMARQLRAVALSPFVGQRLTMLTPKERHADLERLAQLVEDGRLVPAVERTYPLEDASSAMRRLESGQVRGKLVITL